VTVETFSSRVGRALAVVWVAIVAAACGGGAGDSRSAQVTLRLGYLTNLTHATALVGVSKGYFARSLGGSARLQSTTFNAGPDEVEALLSGSIDAAYVGPNPAISAFVRSHGEAVRVVAGAASGGAGLVVKPSIASAGQLKGKTLATPQLGNTQDVALRYWLGRQNLSSTTTGGGDVHISPQDNAQTLQTFKAGQIDGAWVPEPWLSRLVIEGGGKVLVDERTLWPNGMFATTLLLVRDDFLRAHPAVVKGLLEGQVAANDFLQKKPSAAQAAADDALAVLTGKKLSSAILAAAWGNLTFSNDPLASSVKTAAQHAHSLGLLPSLPDLHPLFDVALLDQVLAGDHMTTVTVS